MIEDLLFEKLEFPAVASLNMTLLPASSSMLRSSSGRGAITQSGVIASHRFSASNQPLKAAEFRAIKDLKSRAKKRCVLFRNPYSPSVTASPTANRFGSLTGGALILPRGAIKWQVVRYFTTTTLDKLSFYPVAYAENIILGDNTPVTYDFVTKDSSLGIEPVSMPGSTMLFASFDYWLPCKITQLESVGYRERKLSLSDEDVEYSTSITIEEDPTVTRNIFYSWLNAEEVEKTTNVAE